MAYCKRQRFLSSVTLAGRCDEEIGEIYYNLIICECAIIDYPSPAFHHEPYENTAMAKDKEPLEAFTATAAQAAEQMTKQTQGAMENYFGWLQKTMSTFPWSNTNLNRILLSNATENVTATFAFMHKLSQAKNFQDVIKLQTEFMEKQMNLFNEQ